MATTMRLIAYVTPSDDAGAIRAALLGRPGVTAVACRAARYWDGRPEAGFDACWAASYPGIVAAYAAAGITPFDAPAQLEPLHADELAELPPSADVTIVCPGTHVRAELAAHGTSGAVVVVNEAAHLLPSFAYFVANDGFIAGMATVRQPCVRVTRRARQATLPGGPWYALDRLGVTDGLFSVRCALRLASQALGARRITLIGHDCVPGSGTGASDWSAGLIDACRKATRKDMTALATAGVEVVHVRWNGETTYTDHYLPPTAAAAER